MAAMVSRNRLMKRLDRLESQVQERRESRRQWVQQEAAERRRWKETLTRFIDVLPNNLHDRVEAALRDERCPLWRWLEDVNRGRSRLPECLTEEVMRRLVLIRLDEADRCEP